MLYVAVLESFKLRGLTPKRLAIEVGSRSPHVRERPLAEYCNNIVWHHSEEQAMIIQELLSVLGGRTVKGEAPGACRSGARCHASDP
jgi:hypothetical protein